MNANEIRAKIEERWGFWETFQYLHFTGKRMKFFFALNLPDDSWHDYKVILETIIAEKLEKKGK